MDIVALIALISSWIIYVLTTKSNSDEVYLKNSRHDILGIQTIFEELFKESKEIGRSQSSYHELIIKKLKPSLLSFRMNQSGLFIKNKRAELKIQKCLQEIRIYEYDFKERRPDPHEVVSDLLIIWGVEVAGKYNDTALKELEMFYYAGFFRRLRIRILELIIQNKSAWIALLIFL